jgi:hypothetical protein
MNCQACSLSVPVRLTRTYSSRGEAIGCCTHCQSFTCSLHGVRDQAAQQFRCVQCFPDLLLFNAVLYSGAESESAKAILERQAVAALSRRPPRIDDSRTFLENHDLVFESRDQLLSEFLATATFDLCRPEVCSLGWDKTARDLCRIQSRLQTGSHADTLKAAAGYVAFLYPQYIYPARALPRDMQILRCAIS